MCRAARRATSLSRCAHLAPFAAPCQPCCRLRGSGCQGLAGFSPPASKATFTLPKRLLQAYANSKLCTLLAAKHLDRLFSRWALPGGGEAGVRSATRRCYWLVRLHRTRRPSLRDSFPSDVLTSVPALQRCGAAGEWSCCQRRGGRGGGGRAAGARRVSGGAPRPGGHLPCQKLLQGRLGGGACCWSDCTRVPTRCRKLARVQHLSPHLWCRQGVPPA